MLDEIFTYETGYKNAHTFLIPDINKQKYITYLNNLALKHNSQFLKGVADGLEKNTQPLNLKNTPNWDLFYDRTMSLLERWISFLNKHPEHEKMAISGFLNEINDSYTAAIIINAAKETDLKSTKNGTQ